MPEGPLGQSTDSYVTVKVFAWLRDSFGWKDVRVGTEDAPNMRRLLEHLCASAARNPGILTESGSIAKGFIVLLNGHNLEFQGGAEAVLKSGDEVAIFPPVAGG